jgi:hypothetical protein
MEAKKQYIIEINTQRYKNLNLDLYRVGEPEIGGWAL